jgi:GNAT superfamily N-acetyltransferase
MQYSLLTPVTGYHPDFAKQNISEFLLRQLDEYGDPIEEIENALDFAMEPDKPGKGFVVVAHDQNKITGCVVINETGMKGYIPENILVYIATHSLYRGKGIGKKLMEQAIKLSAGDIALHVEKDNPARFLYEKMGFTNPYLEMRLKKQV